MKHGKRTPSQPRHLGDKGESANTMILPVTTSLHHISVMQEFIYHAMSDGNTEACKLEDGKWTISYREHGDAAATYRALRLLMPKENNIELHEAEKPGELTRITFPEDFVVGLTITMSQLTEELDKIKEMYMRSTARGKSYYAALEDRMARLGLISPIDAQTMYRLRQAYQNALGADEVPSNRDFIRRVQSVVDTLEKGEPFVANGQDESVLYGILMTTMNKVHEARGEALADLSSTKSIDQTTTYSIARIPTQFVDVMEHAVRGMPRHFMGMPTGTREVPPNPYIPEDLSLGR